MIRTEHVRKFAHCRKCGAQTRAAPPFENIAAGPPWPDNVDYS